MKIFTYYKNINFECQDELINLWKKSWKKQGFTSNVLTEIDAKKSDYYNEFIKKIKELHYKITKKIITDYELCCWLRWLAYSTQTEESFFVSDYDFINHNFLPRTPEDKLHLLNDRCPCFASGTPVQFLNLCKKFIMVTEQNLERFIDLHSHYKFKTFHDQNFFVIYYHDIKIDNDILISKNQNNFFLSGPEHQEFWKASLVHYSHAGCKRFCEINNIKYNDITRCDLIKKYTSL
jgi:hypothetical protein